MKLTKKLIPLATIGITGCSIVPFSLTSCSSHGLIGKAYDLVDNFYPDIERHDPDTLSTYVAHHNYLQQLLKNKETFIQDYFWSRSWTGITFEQYVFWMKLLDIPQPTPSEQKIVYGPSKDVYEHDYQTISNLEITTQKATWDGFDWEFPCLSFTLDFDSQIKQSILDHYFTEHGIAGGIVGKVTGQIKFYNVPFYIISRTIKIEGEPERTVPIISFEPFTEWMYGEDSTIIPLKSNYWQINTFIRSTVNGEIEYGGGLVRRIADDWTCNINANSNLPKWKYEDLTLEETLGVAFTTSYYLQQVKLNS